MSFRFFVDTQRKYGDTVIIELSKIRCHRLKRLFTETFPDEPHPRVFTANPNQLRGLTGRCFFFRRSFFENDKDDALLNNVIIPLMEIRHTRIFSFDWPNLGYDCATFQEVDFDESERKIKFTDIE